MDKRYQVFISSTFADLQEERSRVFETVLKMDCFPAGMELFPAADEEQWEFIKKVITDCDYYLLIIGGRYGSVTKEGVSYTEKEYQYAVDRGIKVIAFLHKQPDEIPIGKSEVDPDARKKLAEFRARVATGRLVNFWNTADELPGLVALSLMTAIKMHPAVGWVRGSAVANVEALTELDQLRKHVAELTGEVETLRSAATPQHLVPNLAPLDATVTVHGRAQRGNAYFDYKVTLTWARIFAVVAPELLSHPADDAVKRFLTYALYREHSKDGSGFSIPPYEYQTIKVQLTALGLVSVDYSQTTKGGMGLFWSLTPYGHRVMYELRAVRGENGQDQQAATA
jgi:hypothetical protein